MLDAEKLEGLVREIMCIMLEWKGASMWNSDYHVLVLPALAHM